MLRDETIGWLPRATALAYEDRYRKIAHGVDWIAAAELPGGRRQRIRAGLIDASLAQPALGGHEGVVGAVQQFTANESTD